MDFRPESQPRVAHAIHSGGFYGAERVVLDLMRRQASAEAVRPLLFAFVDRPGDTTELADRAAREGVEVVRFPAPPGLRPGALRRYAAAVRETGAALVHAHGYKPNCFHLLSRVLRWQALPLVATAHGYPRAARRLKSDLYHALDLFLLGRAEAVAAVSAETAEYMARRNPRIRPRVIENGVDADAAPGPARPVRDLFPDLGEGEPVVGTAGRLIPLKNQALLIDVCARIRKDMPLRLLILGDGPERDNLEARMRAAFPGGEGRLLPFQADILSWVDGMDVFVLPSLMEGMPMSLLEAGALAKAAVASAVGGIPDVIRDGESGLLAAPGDGASLEAALRRALADRDTRREWGQALRRTVRERFSLARAEKAYRDLYAEFLPALRSAQPPTGSAP